MYVESTASQLLAHQHWEWTTAHPSSEQITQSVTRVWGQTLGLGWGRDAHGGTIGPGCKARWELRVAGEQSVQQEAEMLKVSLYFIRRYNICRAKERVVLHQIQRPCDHRSHSSESCLGFQCMSWKVCLYSVHIPWSAWTICSCCVNAPYAAWTLLFPSEDCLCAA